MAEHSLTGNYRVRALRSAFSDCDNLFRRTRHKIEVRKHALKLRYWPENHPADDAGQILDVNWSWIRTMRGLKTGELRVDDEIGGYKNLRIIFFVGERIQGNELPIICILAVLQKKRDDFTPNQIKLFSGRRRLVLERFYANRP